MEATKTRSSLQAAFPKHQNDDADSPCWPEVTWDGHWPFPKDDWNIQFGNEWISHCLLRWENPEGIEAASPPRLRVRSSLRSLTTVTSRLLEGLPESLVTFVETLLLNWESTSGSKREPLFKLPFRFHYLLIGSVRAISKKIEKVLSFHMPNQNVVTKLGPRLLGGAGTQVFEFLVQSLD